MTLPSDSAPARSETSPVTAADIKRRLCEKYPLADGWITMAEVTPPKTSRRFDLVAIMGWQSRGHEVMGFEVKVARSDWLRELAAPAKAEPLVRLCSRWWIAAPPGVVNVDELPPSWGLLVIHPEQIRTAKQAPTLEPASWPDSVWRCMMLRLANREAATPDDLAAARAEGARESRDASENAWRRQVEHEHERVAELEAIIHEAEKATGVQLRRWANFPALGEAMAFLREGDKGRMADKLERQAHELRTAAVAMRRAARAVKAVA